MVELPGVEEVPGDVDLERRLGALGQRRLVAAQVHHPVVVLEHRPRGRPQDRDLRLCHPPKLANPERLPVAAASRFARVRRHEKLPGPTRPVRLAARVRGAAGRRPIQRSFQGGGQEARGDPRNLARRDQDRARSRSKAPITVENFLAYVDAKRLLRRHDLPPRDPGLHDPGRRLHAPTCSRSRPRRRSRTRPATASRTTRHDRDGAHRRSSTAPRRSSSSTSQTTQLIHRDARRRGFGYAVFGKVTAGVGRREEDRGREDDHEARPPERAGRRRS